MYLEIYPDIIFILNLFIDFILLFLLTKIARRNSNWIRRIGASAVGASAAVVVSIFPWINLIIRFLLMNIAVSVLMIWITFGRMRVTQCIRLVIVLYLITYFAGGLINSIYYYTDFRETLVYLGNAIILSSVSCKFVLLIILILLPLTYLLLWLLRWYRSEKKETYEVELVYDANTIHTTGLLDTGNCLYDPIFKKPVIVMEASVIKMLLPEKAFQELESIRNMLSVKSDSIDLTGGEDFLRLRFIPYQSVGKAGGIMAGLILDKVLIHTEREVICNDKVTAAICDNSLSVKDAYHVLLHKDLLSL